MTKEIKQIKTIGEALVIIKQLQIICREQREEIKGLKKTLSKIKANKSSSESVVNFITEHLFKK